MEETASVITVIVRRNTVSDFLKSKKISKPQTHIILIILWLRKKRSDHYSISCRRRTNDCLCLSWCYSWFPLAEEFWPFWETRFQSIIRWFDHHAWEHSKNLDACCTAEGQRERWSHQSNISFSFDVILIVESPAMVMFLAWYFLRWPLSLLSYRFFLLLLVFECLPLNAHNCLWYVASLSSTSTTSQCSGWCSE